MALQGSGRLAQLDIETDVLVIGGGMAAAWAAEAAIVASGLLGQFRRDHGWGEWASDPRYENQHWYMVEVFRRARADAAAAEPPAPLRPKLDE